MSDTRYNGLTNYETWAVNLWISNSQGDREYWDERASEILANSEQGEYDWETPEKVALSRLESELSDYFAEFNPLAPEPASVYTDLLGAALGAVDWREIASNMLETVAERQ